MSWHEHLQHLPNKGTITVVSGSTTVTTTINGFIGDFQPILSFSIAAVAGFFTIWVGWLAVREKKQTALQNKELHNLVVQKEKLEILNLKAKYEKNNG